jgi:hypothetical protein
MAVRTCYRCHGNAFLEQQSPGETAWVCLQCGSRSYLHAGETFIRSASLARYDNVERTLR